MSEVAIDCLTYKHFCRMLKLSNITTRLEALYYLNETYRTVKPFMFDFVSMAYENGVLKE